MAREVRSNVGLFKILTGQVGRENKLDDIVVVQPGKRFEQTPGMRNKFLRSCSFALAFTTRSGVRYLLLESKLPEYQAIFKANDVSKISALAAFLAWHEARRALSFLTSDLADNDEMKVGLQKDLPEMAEIMYPPTEAVKAASSAFVDIEKAFLAGQIDTTKSVPRQAALIDQVAGIEPRGSTLFDTIQRSFALSPAYGLWEQFKEILDTDFA